MQSSRGLGIVDSVMLLALIALMAALCVSAFTKAPAPRDVRGTEPLNESQNRPAKTPTNDDLPLSSGVDRKL